MGFVAKTTRDCNGDANLVPVYRFSNNDKYILSRNESPPNDTTLAYAADGIVFYASATMNEDCGPTVPLHSYWVQAHYVYTTDRTMDVLLQMDGGVYRGIVCHIWLNDEPTVTTTTVPTIPTTTVSPHKCQINPGNNQLQSDFTEKSLKRRQINTHEGIAQNHSTSKHSVPSRNEWAARNSGYGHF